MYKYCSNMNKLTQILKSSASLALSKRLSLNLICTTNLLSQQYQDFFKSYQLTEQQYNVLRILRGQKGIPANLMTIQNRMIHKNSNTTRLLDKLVDKNLVNRKICPENRRKIEVCITEKGLNLLHTIDPELDKLEQSFTKSLSEKEQDTLIKLLEKLQ